MLSQKRCIGISGTTGAGKSTLVDILIGLIKPTQGNLWIDGLPVVERTAGLHRQATEFMPLGDWQAQIAHVPQHVYLVDSTIAANIAFGIPQEQLDYANVWQVLEQTQMAEFIRSLPDGLQTCIGERGVRLSGGQRQRIGIARALYKRAPVLILDEATSALDHETEEAIVSGLAQLNSEITLIIISHRPMAFKHCHTRYHLDRGDLIRY